MKTLGLHLRVEARALVRGLDWEIKPGECWCVLGRNGSGKSTLLRTLAGLRQPDTGEVRLLDRSLSAWPLQELARQRAYLAQTRSDAFGYRVIETVMSARHPYQGHGYWESEENHRIALAALASLDMAHMSERNVRTLSGGERQRVAIAATLAQDAPFLLLDEPVNALDLGHQVSVMSLLANLCKNLGKAIVLVSHDLNLAHGVASHALLLMEGGVWVAGPVAEVMQASLLEKCLGHPIEIVRHGDRLIYLPGP